MPELRHIRNKYISHLILSRGQKCAVKKRQLSDETGQNLNSHLNQGNDMKIFITDSLGFVVRHLSIALLEDGHRITAVGRTPEPTTKIEHPAFKYLAADTTKPGDWQSAVADHNNVINLAGKSIPTHWTKSYPMMQLNGRKRGRRLLCNQQNSESHW
jgi:hypothetical protein